MISFAALQPEYHRLLSTMKVTRSAAINAAASKVIKNYDRYGQASVASGVPSAWIGAVDLRESDCNPYAGLGQGDPWNRVSVHVPAGKGPFKSWSQAAIYYLAYDGVSKPAIWTMEYACYRGEAWNGWGYRGHGIFSPYLWAGTNQYRAGKYVADGVWSGSAVDQQVGIIPVILEIARRYPSVAIGQPIKPSDGTAPATPLPDPADTGTMWIQKSLNKLRPSGMAAIPEDGDYGRLTRWAVIEFQARYGLEPDGQAGDLTTAMMDQKLKELAHA